MQIEFCAQPPQFEQLFCEAVPMSQGLLGPPDVVVVVVAAGLEVLDEAVGKPVVLEAVGKPVVVLEAVGKPVVVLEAVGKPVVVFELLVALGKPVELLSFAAVEVLFCAAGEAPPTPLPPPAPVAGPTVPTRPPSVEP
jgi:hypothetical protein